MSQISALIQKVAPFGASRWEPTCFGDAPRIPIIGRDDVVRLFDHIDLWDCWPLAHEDGRTVQHLGRSWWFFLSAPVFADPVERHGHARIRLLSIGDGGWIDHGNAFPDGMTPGSREWAGSAVLMDDGVTVQHFFTAAGRRGEQAMTFEQRIFSSEGRLGDAGPGQWQEPREILIADGVRYVYDKQDAGAPGLIKGFRDPAWLRDPATGLAHLLFTGSAAWTDHAFNGNVGMATLMDGEWKLVDPLIEATGVNNELERPHVIVRDGHYYLFWSTQTHTFAPGAVAGPNALYGMVADSLAGPWRPINGTSIVAANPDAEAKQSYSWWVTGEGVVWSFVDYWGMEGRTTAECPALLRSNFGGTPAPRFSLNFDGDSVTIA
ncbi:glycoside hydrolase family 68 protein [Novosphingobium sp. ES2-1]|uniref:glycoside hydrolase family 68 protein n=1 Tax=Novosphingobium sp. ES2-1 TaxID=2780074 RepID=UPI00187EF7C3|nr:glycoside hydrolase family 68 protein [Novosphingobium sp. ES2-1]QOV92705.1 glycoside hydrolase family 68 protein [Novosphingobium sp. ES2-1]